MNPIRELFESLSASGKVPAGWQPATTHKVKVKNRALLAELRKLKHGEWKKVYSSGVDGTEIHYFEHQSGVVFNVKTKRVIC